MARIDLAWKVYITAPVLSCRAIARTRNVCISCHKDSGGDAAKPVEEWEKSIHAKVEGGASCHNCHGGDPTSEENAKSEQRGFRFEIKPSDIPGMCGKCHPKIKAHFAEAPLEARRQLNCAVCHGYHSIQRATVDVIREATCGKCHQGEEKNIILEVRQAIRSANEAIDSLTSMVENLEERGYHSYRLRRDLESARKSTELLPEVFHTFRPSELMKLSNRAVSIQRRIARREKDILEKIQLMKRRRRIGTVIAFLLLVFGFFVLYYSHSFPIKKED